MNKSELLQLIDDSREILENLRQWTKDARDREELERLISLNQDLEARIRASNG